MINLLLQILDDGRVTDSNGRTVDFKNTIIIMTSNLGSEYVLDDQKEKVLNEVKSHFRPEFINRIDEIIIFNTLTEDVLSKILDKIIHDIEIRLSDLNIEIEISDKARHELISVGYDISFGARPLKRLISNTIEVKLAKMLIENKVKANSKIFVDYVNNDYEIKVL